MTGIRIGGGKVNGRKRLGKRGRDERLMRMNRERKKEKREESSPALTQPDVRQVLLTEESTWLDPDSLSLTSISAIGLPLLSVKANK